jgi:hypothetical protein
MVAVYCRVAANTGGTQILDNSFDYLMNIVDAQFRYTCIEVSDLDLANAYVDIKNNVMQCIPQSGEYCGIQLSDFGKISGYGRVNVSGNDIHMPVNSTDGQDSNYWGIRSDQTGSFFLPHFDWTISNNNIRMYNDGASGNMYGIEIISVEDFEKAGTGVGAHTGFLITGNNIMCDLGTSSGDVVGIKFTGVGATISNNNITVEDAVNAATSSCIDVRGHWINVIGNMVQVDGDAAGITGEVGARTNFDTGHADGFISISNNFVIATLTTGAAINIISQIGSTCLSINGNTVHAEYHVDNPSDIVWIIDNGNGGGGHSISNNMLWEIEEPATGSTRAAIGLATTGVAKKGVVINGNVIGSPNFNFGTLRGTLSTAISVFGDDGLQGLAVCNNVIQGWVDEGQANRRSISIQDVYGVTCVGNSCAYSGVAGEPVIRIFSCENVTVSANEADDYSIYTSGSTDVLTTGTNNGNII